MKSILVGMVGAILIVVAFIAGAWWAAMDCASRVTHAAPVSSQRGSNIEVREAGNRVFIFDKESGQAWRYFVNRDEHGKATSEGFVQLTFRNLPDKSEVNGVSAEEFLADGASPSPAHGIDFVPLKSPTPTR